MSTPEQQTETEILFISDLHLSPDYPATVERFLQFLQKRAPLASTLFILGDLFDAWIGDDNNEPPYPQIRYQLAVLTDSGTEVMIQHGNRDFLLGSSFCMHTGAELIPEEFVINLFGVPTLLMHGDTLCTDDTDYQQARQFLRSPQFLSEFLGHSLDQRAAIAADYRRRSGEATSLLPADIMDVNQNAVETVMRKHHVRRLIHGHTHRQDVHHFQIDEASCERYVLGEWRPDHGMALSVSAVGIKTILV